MNPMLGREIAASQKGLSIFDQTRERGICAATDRDARRATVR